MKLIDLKAEIRSCLHDIAFEYQGKPGLINPWNHKIIELGYDNYTGCYSDVDILLSDRVINSKSLIEICEEVEFEIM